MKKTILWGLLVVCSWAMHVSRVVAAGDPEAGKKKFYTCEGCHGVAGYMNVYPSYHVPRLGAAARLRGDGAQGLSGWAT